MQIVLYYNSSEKIALDKELEEINTIQGRILENTSIINPSILIDSDTTILSANYLYIPDFNRFYFITDITNVSNNKWKVSAHIDVLHTYAQGIRENTAIIERQENEYNLYLDDSMYRAYQNEDIQYKKLSGVMPSMKFILLVNGGGAGLSIT